MAPTAKQTKAKAQPAQADADDLVGKRIQFDRATWDAVELLAREPVSIGIPNSHSPTMPPITP